MAAQTILQEHYVALTHTVKSWDQRLRLQQTLLWLPRSLMSGLALGIVIAGVARIRPLLQPEQIALITGVAVALGLVIMLLAVWLWRRPAITAARRFDVLFRLNERVSTALEISEGTIRTNDELARRQLEDARSRASAVRASDHLPLMLRRKDWLTVLMLLIVLALLLVLPNPQSAALTQAAQQQVAINDAADTLRDLTEDVAADSALSDDQRRALLEELKNATNTLEQPNVTPEEAFAAASDVQSSLQQRANDLSQQAQANQAALAQAADAMRQAGQQNGANSDQSASVSADQVNQSLSDLAQNADTMSDAQRQAAMQAMQDAAQSLQDTNPQAAQQLMQAAQNFQQMTQAQSQQAQSGNTQNGQQQTQQQAQQQAQQSLQQSLQQAQQQVQQQAQQTQQQQAQSQSMQDAADQAQQSAEQISQAQQQQGQQGQQQQQQGGQSQPQQQQGQQQSPRNQQGQPQQGQQGQPQDQQGGQQQAQSMQSVQNSPGESQQPGSQAQQGQQQQSPNASGGAGDTPGGTGDDNPGTDQQSDMSSASNNPDGQGQGQFEAVNVPRHIGDQANDGNNVQLDANASGSPVQEGNFSENPNGQVTVPYNQVFSNYANTANQALNSDYVPLGLRDVVRDYFTSLEPKP